MGDFEMTRKRYLQVERNGGDLTTAEQEAGWHFCWDWDGMLVNRYDTQGEGSACTCFAAPERRDG